MGKEFYSIASVAVKNQMNVFVNVQSSCVVSESGVKQIYNSGKTNVSSSRFL